MALRFLSAALLLAASSLLCAAEPNIQPGEWEFVSRTTFPGTPMPEQEMITRECVSADDIRRALAVDADLERCEILERTQDRDGVSYTMLCHQDGMEIFMDAEIRFLGDHAEAFVDTRIQTPLGPMHMETALEGRRVDDC